MWNHGEASGITSAVVLPRDDGLTVELSHSTTPGRFLETTFEALKTIDDESERFFVRLQRDERTPVEQRTHDTRTRALDSRREDIERALGRVRRRGGEAAH